MTTTLNEWEHKRTLRNLRLPSGAVVDYRLPDLKAFMAYGQVVNPIAEMAARFELKGISMDELVAMSMEERRALYELELTVVGDCLVNPSLAHLDADERRTWVAEKMPPEDRYVLWRFALHISPPEGLDAADMEAAMATLMELRTFHDGNERRDVPADLSANGSGALDGGGD